jgi:hypothetical protein
VCVVCCVLCCRADTEVHACSVDPRAEQARFQIKYRQPDATACGDGGGVEGRVSRSICSCWPPWYASPPAENCKYTHTHTPPTHHTPHTSHLTPHTSHLTPHEKRVFFLALLFCCSTALPFARGVYRDSESSRASRFRTGEKACVWADPSFRTTWVCTHAHWCVPSLSATYRWCVSRALRRWLRIWGGVQGRENYGSLSLNATRRTLEYSPRTCYTQRNRKSSHRCPPGCPCTARDSTRCKHTTHQPSTYLLVLQLWESLMKSSTRGGGLRIPICRKLVPTASLHPCVGRKGHTCVGGVYIYTSRLDWLE